MFNCVIKNYYGMVVGMQEGFYSIEECESKARELMVSNYGTQATIYEDGNHIKSLNLYD